jgi:glycosyltransferase involved in cell wall biosynthesis
METWTEHKPLRVLMTTDTVGGVWSYAVELCRSLQQYSVHFYLVTTGAALSAAQKTEIAQLANVTVFETAFLLEWMEAPWQSIDESCAWLLQLEQELEPDLIHLNAFVYGALPFKAPVIVAAHSDVFSWWLAVKGEQPPAGWRTYFSRVQAGMQGAHFLIAPSTTMMDAVRKIYDVAIPGAVIYNGRSGQMFCPAQKAPFIFSMGRIWDEAKNISLLVAAAPQIPYAIKLAGDNDFAGDHCETSGANISYLGKLSSTEVAAQLAAASVYVLPAKYEPFGLSVLEAALSGCALVLGNIDSLQEIWGDSALYIDTDNAGALAKAVNFLMQDEAARLHYAQKAAERAKRYTTAALAENYVRVYGQLIQNKKRNAKQEIA